MKKYTIKITGIIILVVGVIFGYILYSSTATSSSIARTSILADTTSTKDTAPVITSEDVSSTAVGMAVEYVADFSNNRVLMGASHNVFVAKVIKQIGNIERGIGPETQFEVQIVLNIKGNLQGTVTLDQEGGYDNGILYYIDGGASLLEPGTTYLLATRYNPQENWYTLNPSIFGSQFIIHDETASINQLQALAQNDTRVKQLEEAYPNEILLDADVENDNALNSYQSLHGGLPSSSISADTSTQL